MTRLVDRHHAEGQPGITQAALFGMCPGCGARSLWEAPATFAPECPACGLEFAQVEPRGRMQFLIVLPVTIALIAAALWLDEIFRPPLLIQALIWVPLVPLTMIIALRFVKSAMLLVYLRAARQNP